MTCPKINVSREQLAEKRRLLEDMASTFGHSEDDLSRRQETLAKLRGALDTLEMRLETLGAAEGQQAEILVQAIASAWTDLEGEVERLLAESKGK